MLMILDHRNHQVSRLHTSLSALLHPVRLIVDFPSSAGNWFRESMTSRHDLQEENAILKTQQLVLQAQLQKMESLEAENLRLRSLMDSSFNTSNHRMLIAELMAVDLDPYRHQFTINKGSNHDLYEGQPVIDSGGIMGQLVRVGPFSATAMLITDPGHAIPVQVNRNGLRTIALGTGSTSVLKLPHIPNNTDIKVGDLITTSGLGGRFPAGYPVGEITQIEQMPDRDFSQIIARPSAHLDRSRVVLLLWPAALHSQQSTDSVDSTTETAVEDAE